MATITALMVKNLRAKTDLPMMECKQALVECDGSEEAAMEWLRKKHKGKMAERSDRTTGEGRVAIHIDDARKIGAIIELQCETAPVARNELFVNLANTIAMKVASGSEVRPDPEVVLKDPKIEAQFTEVYGKMQETMKLTRCQRVEGGHLSSYVHHDGKSGVLLALSSEPKSDKNVGADLCMHSLFTLPLAIHRSSVPAEQVEKVRSEAVEMAKEAGKPEQIVEKIAEGKVNAFFGERVLLEQLHVKSDDYGKKKIGDVLKEADVKEVTELAIMKVGG